MLFLATGGFISAAPFSNATRFKGREEEPTDDGPRLCFLLSESPSLSEGSGDATDRGVGDGKGRRGRDRVLGTKARDVPMIPASTRRRDNQGMSGGAKFLAYAHQSLIQLVQTNSLIITEAASASSL